VSAKNDREPRADLFALLLELDRRWLSHPAYLGAFLCGIVLLIDNDISESNGSLGRALVKLTAVTAIALAALAVHRYDESHSKFTKVTVALLATAGSVTSVLMVGAPMSTIGNAPGSTMITLAISICAYIEYNLSR
jgi:hypothetical protein